VKVTPSIILLMELFHVERMSTSWQRAAITNQKTLALWEGWGGFPEGAFARSSEEQAPFGTAPEGKLPHPEKHAHASKSPFAKEVLYMQLMPFSMLKDCSAPCPSSNSPRR
jgi:hypothetical protein